MQTLAWRAIISLCKQGGVRGDCNEKNRIAQIRRSEEPCNPAANLRERGAPSSLGVSCEDLTLGADHLDNSRCLDETDDYPRRLILKDPFREDFVLSSHSNWITSRFNYIDGDRLICLSSDQIQGQLEHVVKIDGHWRKRGRPCTICVGSFDRLRALKLSAWHLQPFDDSWPIVRLRVQPAVGVVGGVGIRALAQIPWGFVLGPDSVHVAL